MEMNEVIEKIGEDKLKEALKSGDSKAVQALIEASGLGLTDEQLEYIAGGHGFGIGAQGEWTRDDGWAGDSDEPGRYTEINLLD